MLKPTCAIALFVCAHYCSIGQSVSTLMGSRANALAYSSACLQDEWSLFNNVAGLSKVEQPSLSTAYDWQPSLPIGNRMAAGLCLPTKIGVAGIGFFRFGDALYNEQILSGGFANQFGLASIGAKINYIQYNAEGFGRKGVVTVSLGGIAELTPTLKVGAYIININQPVLSKDEKEKIPTTLVTGVAFTPTEKVMIAAQIEKDIEYQFAWKAALEYKPFKKASFRTGFNVHPGTAFFGMGFQSKKFRLDYALQYSVVTGTGHQASIVYHFKKG
ncbi:MAG TPA: hypothetical protein VFW11_04270 [Cyclobacteriaceae bacterium]|nr:hypothetical protein [Cyclobacteriaceae bacterium]